MSEYQYFEFQAIDRPLTAKEQASLRKYSSRATITSSRFAVDYSWGDFKGNADEWMEKYFDAFLYLANWGTHELMLRLPRGVLPLETAKSYCAGDFASARAKGKHVVLAFRAEDEEREEWMDDESETLASLLPVRAELASGDLRALYLAWLGCAQAGELDNDDEEPPCPPGLCKLSPALEEFARFLRIDDDLVQVAASASPDSTPCDNAALKAWVMALPEAKKASILVALLQGSEALIRGELLRRFRASRTAQAPAFRTRARTVGELLEAAENQAEARRRKQAERVAREGTRRERAASEARERHLSTLAKREAQARCEIDALIATKQPKKYDEAVVLLRDLQEVCARAGRQDEAAKRIAVLCAKNARKPSLIERLRRAGLVV